MRSLAEAWSRAAEIRRSISRREEREAEREVAARRREERKVKGRGASREEGRMAARDSRAARWWARASSGRETGVEVEVGRRRMSEREESAKVVMAVERDLGEAPKDFMAVRTFWSELGLSEVSSVAHHSVVARVG